MYKIYAEGRNLIILVKIDAKPLPNIWVSIMPLRKTFEQLKLMKKQFYRIKSKQFLFGTNAIG